MKRAFFNSDRVLAIFTDREGGVSQKPYDSLNIALHVGDDIKNVAKNRVILSQRLGFNIENLIYMQQTHNDNIEIVKNSFENEIKECDGILTNIPNIPLMVMVADCIPILLYDEENRVVGAVHSGRNGTFKKIVIKAIKKMVSYYNSKIENIKVSIGISIHNCCYQIGKEIVDIVIKNFGKKYIEEREDKFYLDLQILNLDLLLKEGIKRENIEIFEECSCCQKNYFSYRREGVTGRFAGIIMLKNKEYL